MSTCGQSPAPGYRHKLVAGYCGNREAPETRSSVHIPSARMTHAKLRLGELIWHLQHAGGNFQEVTSLDCIRVAWRAARKARNSFCAARLEFKPRAITFSVQCDVAALHSVLLPVLEQFFNVLLSPGRLENANGLRRSQCSCNAMLSRCALVMFSVTSSQLRNILQLPTMRAAAIKNCFCDYGSGRGKM